MFDAGTLTPQSALGGARFDGYAEVREIGPVGMITLRAKPGTVGLASAIDAVTGGALPAQRRVVVNGDKAAAWMSPDEYLLMLPYADVSRAVAELESELRGAHFLAADVSDARALFRVQGPKAAEVLAKICPVDFAALEPAEMRRTRAAQVAVALWRDADGFTLVCFRSVAGYVMGLLSHSAMRGSEIY